MFRKKRSVIQNAFAGRLPLRDVDFNETYVLDSSKPPSAEKKSIQETPHTSSTSTQPNTRKDTHVQLQVIRNKTPSAEKKAIQETPHTSSTRPNTKTDAHVQLHLTRSKTQTPKPLSTLTTTPHTTNTPSVSSKPLSQTSSQKAEPSRQENPVTPASTFPVSNPAVIQHATNNTNPPTPSTASAVRRCLKSSVPKPLSLAATAEENSQQTGATPLCRPPAVPPGPALSERKAATGEQDSQIVVLNDRMFKKLCVLGTGGSSKVFKVLSEDFQVYALKEVYIKHVDSIIKEAYINEIKLLKKLRTKQEIITLHNYDYDKVEGVLYLLLEYAEMDLHAVVKNWNKTNHMINVLYFWNQMLLAVKVIHAEGVVHNDLKPANFVLIGAELKLIDFGISKRIEAEHTSFERDTRCGTSNYMSPETIQINEGKDCFKVGRPSDVWSLGCILYLMVYGRTPFEHIKGQLNKWNAIISPNEAIHFPYIENKALIDIMKKCLNREPKERPTINELIAHPYSRNIPMS